MRGSTNITTLDDFSYTQTGTNNTILIFGCDDSDCSDSNGIITPGDVIGVFYENVNGRTAMWWCCYFFKCYTFCLD